MGNFKTTMAAAWRALIVLIALAVHSMTPASGQSTQARIVGNDRGGLIGQRVIEVAELNASQTAVELRGRICHSACTLYLGADNICVSPQTSFGFHGPTNHGAPLQAALFDHWSAVMARHYKPTLRRWFMQKARYRRFGYMRLTGRELIALGYPACR